MRFLNLFSKTFFVARKSIVDKMFFFRDSSCSIWIWLKVCSVHNSIEFIWFRITDKLFRVPILSRIVWQLQDNANCCKRNNWNWQWLYGAFAIVNVQIDLKTVNYDLKCFIYYSFYWEIVCINVWFFPTQCDREAAYHQIFSNLPNYPFRLIHSIFIVA